MSEGLNILTPSPDNGQLTLQNPEHLPTPFYKLLFLGSSISSLYFLIFYIGAVVGGNRTEVVYRAPSSGNCSITHLETLILISFLIPPDISHIKPFSSTCSTRRADMFAKHSIT